MCASILLSASFPIPTFHQYLQTQTYSYVFHITIIPKWQFPEDLGEESVPPTPHNRPVSTESTTAAEYLSTLALVAAILID